MNNLLKYTLSTVFMVLSASYLATRFLGPENVAYCTTGNPVSETIYGVTAFVLLVLSIFAMYKLYTEE